MRIVSVRICPGKMVQIRVIEDMQVDIVPSGRSTSEIICSEALSNVLGMFCCHVLLQCYIISAGIM